MANRFSKNINAPKTSKGDDTVHGLEFKEFRFNDNELLGWMVW